MEGVSYLVGTSKCIFSPLLLSRQISPNYKGCFCQRSSKWPGEEPQDPGRFQVQEQTWSEKSPHAGEAPPTNPQVRASCPVSLAGPQLCCAGALNALSAHCLHLRQTRPFLVHLMPRWNPSGCGVQGPTRKVRPLAARGEAVGRVRALGLLPNPRPHRGDHRCSPLGCQCHSGPESSCLRNISAHAGDSLVSSKRLFVELMLPPKAGVVWGEVDVDVVSSAPLPGDCHCETRLWEALR